MRAILRAAERDQATGVFGGAPRDQRCPFPRALRGRYTFSSLANFLAGAYNNGGFTQTFGASEVSQTNPNVGLFVQGEWTVHSSVTVNAGLRYDLQWLPEPIQVHTSVPTRYQVDTLRPATIKSSWVLVERLFTMPTAIMTTT